MGKILIFYKYIAIANPRALVQEQRVLCEKLSLKGRILIAHEGINATVGGSPESIESYKSIMLSHPLFSDVDYKESEGESAHFPRLKVFFKKEIVCLRQDTQEINARDAGRALTPEETHQLLSEKPENLLVLDARNNYESRIGKFMDAVTPDINNFRDFPDYIDQNLENFKDKKVLMYCTAGVRCERATAYLKKKNVAQEVLHIRGGIHRYIEEYPEGFFKGKNYVFDGRVTYAVTQDILGHCEHCNVPYDDYSNCVNAECNKQIIVCPPCIEVYHNTCGKKCLELVKNSKVNVRTLPHKIVIPALKTQN